MCLSITAIYSPVRNRRGVAISGGIGKSLKVNKRGGPGKSFQVMSMGWAVINGCGDKINICIGYKTLTF